MVFNLLEVNFQLFEKPKSALPLVLLGKEHRHLFHSRFLTFVSVNMIKGYKCKNPFDNKTTHILNV